MSIAERVCARVLNANVEPVSSNEAQPEQAPATPLEPEAPARATAETVTLVARVAARFAKAIRRTPPA